MDTQDHSQHTGGDAQNIIHRVSITSVHFSEVGLASLQQEADEGDGPPSVSELLGSDSLTTEAIKTS